MFRTHSRSRSMFSVVFERLPIPNIADCPSHQADDIGARFADPSAFRLLISTTGVPKYSTLRSAFTCMTTLQLSRSKPQLNPSNPSPAGQQTTSRSRTPNAAVRRID